MPPDQRPVDEDAIDEEFFGNETYWIVAPPPPPGLGLDDVGEGETALEQMLARMMGGAP